MQTTQHAWAAGFIDGEGTVLVRRSKSRGYVGYVGYVQAVQIDLEPLERLVRIFGGTIYQKKRMNENHHQCWVWMLTKQAEIERALDAMAPYLTVKRRAASLVRNWRRFSGKCSRFRTRTTWDTAFSEWFVSQVRKKPPPVAT